MPASATEVVAGATALTSMKYFDGVYLLNCRRCQQPLRDEYYLLNGRDTFCARCKRAYLRKKLGSPAGAFFTAWFYGTVAGLFGALVNYVVMVTTANDYGMIAAFIGFLVGKAVAVGSRGRGGYVYEALAIFVSYYCIVASWVPFIVSELYEEWGVTEPTLLAHILTGAFAWVKAWMTPFLELPESVFTWALIAVSFFFAWRLNVNPASGISVIGPLRNPASTQAANGGSSAAPQRIGAIPPVVPVAPTGVAAATTASR